MDNVRAVSTPLLEVGTVPRVNSLASASESPSDEGFDRTMRQLTRLALRRTKQAAATLSRIILSFDPYRLSGAREIEVELPATLRESCGRIADGDQRRSYCHDLREYADQGAGAISRAYRTRSGRTRRLLSRAGGAHQPTDPVP